MAIKKCPNGHQYNTNIYGDNCPICSNEGNAQSGPASVGPETRIGGGPSPSSLSNQASNLHTHIATAAASSAQSQGAGETKIRPQDAEPHAGGHTVIRHAQRPGMLGKNPTRKLVGFLITYNREPNGRAFNIYEGRNYIGRDPQCDICVSDDSQMSGKHLSILYRNVDGKFKFRDEQSSNGTFVNKELLDDGELQNHDIIRAGETLFIFVAIPNLF